MAVEVDPGVSANPQPPCSAPQALTAGQAQGIPVTKLDRPTRSVRDLGQLLDDYFDRRGSQSAARSIPDAAKPEGNELLLRIKAPMDLTQLLNHAMQNPALAIAELVDALRVHELYQKNLATASLSGERAGTILVDSEQGGLSRDYDLSRDSLVALAAVDEYSARRFEGKPGHLTRLKLSSGREYWIARRLAPELPRVMARQPQYLQFWLRNHCVRPAVSQQGIRIEMRKAVICGSRLCEDNGCQMSLTVFKHHAFI